MGGTFLSRSSVAGCLRLLNSDCGQVNALVADFVRKNFAGIGMGLPVSNKLDNHVDFPVSACVQRSSVMVSASWHNSRIGWRPILTFHIGA
ncbi:hypothetical protein ECAE60S_01435 [Eoetvoesiella caeni]